MVTSVARQSIVIKCKLKKSILLGNYEFYYAAGLIGKLTGQTFDFDVSPEEMSAAAQEALKNYTPKDDREEYLAHIFSNYKPDEEKNEQMKELFSWGLTENAIWQESDDRLLFSFSGTISERPVG